MLQLIQVVEWLWGHCYNCCRWLNVDMLHLFQMVECRGGWMSICYNCFRWLNVECWCGWMSICYNCFRCLNATPVSGGWMLICYTCFRWLNVSMLQLLQVVQCQYAAPVSNGWMSICITCFRWLSGRWASWDWPSMLTSCRGRTAEATSANSPPPSHSLDTHRWSLWCVTQQSFCLFCDYQFVVSKVSVISVIISMLFPKFLSFLWLSVCCFQSFCLFCDYQYVVSKASVISLIISMLFPKFLSFLWLSVCCCFFLSCCSMSTEATTYGLLGMGGRGSCTYT